MIIKRFSRSNEDLEKLSDYELTRIVKKGENRHKTTRDLGTASGLVGAAIAGNLAKRDPINAAGAGGVGHTIAQGVGIYDKVTGHRVKYKKKNANPKK